jgi:hypothetical protein
MPYSDGHIWGGDLGPPMRGAPARHGVFKRSGTGWHEENVKTKGESPALIQSERGSRTQIQRVMTRRCCCRRPGIGAGGVEGPPNSRSKNDGPEKPLLSLAKLTPAGRLPVGCE